MAVSPIEDVIEDIKAGKMIILVDDEDRENPGAHMPGMDLRLPGYADNGPTLEIYNYNILESRSETAANRPGFGHIAFLVDDVASAQKAVLQAGGRAVGEIVTLQIVTGAKVTWCYVTDPEGNIVVLQSWTN